MLLESLNALRLCFLVHSGSVGEAGDVLVTHLEDIDGSILSTVGNPIGPEEVNAVSNDLLGLLFQVNAVQFAGEFQRLEVVSASEHRQATVIRGPLGASTPVPLPNHDRVETQFVAVANHGHELEERDGVVENELVAVQMGHRFCIDLFVDSEQGYAEPKSC